MSGAAPEFNAIPHKQSVTSFHASYQVRLRHIRDISATKALPPFLILGGVSARPILVNAFEDDSSKDPFGGIKTSKRQLTQRYRNELRAAVGRNTE
jgi:hypothetical protein